ncbi:MAG: tRNA-dihydrouridine synthase [Nitrosopumilus sp.]|nr:tRNA-dihydrouridine synthase [Nitrosopumilus sp.]CAI9831889.1 TIM-barrel protein, nifR3 family [Nitrosopumilaceae archaeon]MDA7944702.1 tRNA-dihydrouridine synthase [Nitrosopumilus sp.]MDA7952864.1 tRNA-dihydrouridine synthase [Nitrosopumilus sp.]MDA7954343.1 tRNA-dihydrouridine synthase [Nitrosopumilus sp.]
MLPRFAGRAFLAPMAGVSDPALRLLCRRAGAGLVVTELTSVSGIVARARRGEDVRRIVGFSEEERPVSVQLFGSDLEALEEAARLVEPHFDAIDYNMGCPAPHITAQMAGGALLQEASLTRQIFSTLVSAVSKPVTLKVRAGVTDSDRGLYLEAARIAEDEGIEMVTLHPRTVSQGYSGDADWRLIRELKRSTGLPVVGNGDIRTPEDAARMIRYTGCDYVMVGRGAMGNPAIFSQINEYLETGSYRGQTAADRVSAFFEYMALAAAHGIRIAQLRTQAMRFVHGIRGAPGIRSRICAARDAAQLEAVMRGIRAA